MAELSNVLKQKFNLQINEQKSGVYDAYSRRFLGFDFIRNGKNVEIRRHKYQKKVYYREWHPSIAKRINQEYHILKNGVLNKKDFALLFENKDEKHHIPVEATEQINLYNEVVLPSAVLRTLSNSQIRLALFDKFGNLQGYYLPKGYTQDSKTVLLQCMAYNDKKLRLKMAKSMEIAAIHNIRANIRYYNKKNSDFKNIVEEMKNGIKKIDEAKTIDEILLIEARCRQIYYQAFNKILNNSSFAFESRTRRPPKDPVNSLIGFGNTLLYNRIQQVIWRTSLDSRIGVFHSANRRHFTLNLDFADIFKPIIVDRIIFTLINKGRLQKSDFIYNDDGSVYLDYSGKRIFIEAFENKLRSRITIKEKKYTYQQLIEREVRLYLNHLLYNEDYKPYKYY